MNIHTNPFIQNTPVARVAKLKNVIKRHKKLVIGVDFDDTLRCYRTDMFFAEVTQAVVKAYNAGHVICIWTANEDTDMVKAALKEQGIKYHHFNESPLNKGAVKPHFNLLLDDNAGLADAFNQLLEILDLEE